VALDGRRRRATAARIVERQPDRTLVELTLMEGCKHEVRRMLKALNHPVENLERIAIGPISGEDLWPGQWRRLTQGEVEALRAGRRSGPARPAARRPSRRDNREGRRTTRPSR
jgi:23S rRNA pseudouridine2605 synthase